MNAQSKMYVDMFSIYYLCSSTIEKHRKSFPETLIEISTNKFEIHFFRHGRRTAPKFGTHVWIETRLALTKKQLTHPTPGGFRGLSIDACGRCDVCLWVCGMMFVGCVWRPPDRAQIWHACADRYSYLKKNLTHPTPGGFRGSSIVKNLSRRTAPKFGTHVRIYTLTLKTKFDPPHPRGV